MRFRAVALAALIVTLSLGGVEHAFAAERGPVVDVVEINGVIDPPTANYLLGALLDSNRRGAELVVIVLDSPGGLNTSSDAILRRITFSKVPVAVFVGPQRAKAGGTAALMTAAAHVSAIGPSARLGPAFPSNLAVDPHSGRGRRLLDAEREELSSIADAHRRDAPLYLNTSIPASAALSQHQVDYEVVSVAELLEKANGRTVTTAAGERTLHLDKAAVIIRFHKPGPIPRLLHTLAIPSLVYVLLLTGVLLIAFEIFQPGFGVAGVTGALLLTGGVYGLTVLPTHVWAVALFFAGCVLCGVDVALDGLGPPSFVGLPGILIGSLAMFPGPAGVIRTPWWLAVLGTVTAFVFFVPAMTIVRRARKPVRSNADATLVGRSGQVRSILNPEGYVWVSDALWRARCDETERIRVGEDVTVTGLDGALLLVRRA